MQAIEAGARGTAAVSLESSFGGMSLKRLQVGRTWAGKQQRSVVQ